MPLHEKLLKEDSFLSILIMFPISFNHYFGCLLNSSVGYCSC